MTRGQCIAALTLSVTLLAPDAHARDLTFADRVRAQAALERVYRSQRTGPGPGIPDEIPAHVLEGKVRKYLEQSVALEELWHTPITAEMLEREIARVARDTLAPQRLGELLSALGHDAFLVQECLARPLLADRLARSFFATDERVHGLARPRADAAAEVSWDSWWKEARKWFDAGRVRAVADPASVLPDPVSLAGSTADDCEPSDRWANRSLDDVPAPRIHHTAVWTGREMIVWGGGVVFGEYGVTDRGSRYDPETDDWASTSITNAPSPRSRHTAVWTGREMIVWGGIDDLSLEGPSLLPRTGGRYDPVTDSWTPTSTEGAPPGRIGHATVWTGREMLVWGGRDDGWDPVLIAGGGRYDPFEDSWTPISTDGAPEPRYEPAAVWTGREMLVWGGGGDTSTTNLKTGGRYDPLSDTWSPISLEGAPSPRRGASAVWTGSRMVVWGGFEDFDDGLNTGGLYDPQSNTWTPMTTEGAPRGSGQLAVWSGGEMLVLSGRIYMTDPPGPGGRYDPAADRWTTTTTINAPAGRSWFTAVWTGRSMIVWGGGGFIPVHGSPLDTTNTGARYDPVHDSWTPTTTTEGAPTERGQHTAVWTGDAMLVWGGYGPSGSTSSGGVYVLATDSWTPMSNEGAPERRREHTAVWTGHEMIVWGGRLGSQAFGGGGRYDPWLDRWLPTSTEGAPEPRTGHTAVWTGGEMLVWGGRRTSGSFPFDLDTGGRYDPGADRWEAVPTTGAPEQRHGHSAVWTGREMVIWGGRNVPPYPQIPQYFLAGGRYDPVADSWTPTSTVGAPRGREGHAAVWTGGEMLIWSGTLPLVEGGGPAESGGRFDPAADRWGTITTTGAPRTDWATTAIWTGSEMVVLGVDDHSNLAGGRYDPGIDHWTPLSNAGSPHPRTSHTAVWAPGRMVVWGGSYFTGEVGSRSLYYTDGGTYVIGDTVDDDGDGLSECVGDCDDDDASTFPGASEICDGLDQDCNGAADDDRDGDGHAVCADCDDGDAAAFPNAPEICDGKDQDCSGTPDDADADADEYLVCADCDDTDPTVHTGRTVTGVGFADDKIGLSWDRFIPVRGRPIVYDVVRGLLSELPVGSGSLESCLVAGSADPMAIDAELPPPGDGYWYVVRARDGCVGDYGTTSAGQTRPSSACPP